MSSVVVTANVQPPLSQFTLERRCAAICAWVGCPSSFLSCICTAATNDRHHALVPRHSSVYVEAYDQKGNLLKFTAEGWHARVIQHEYVNRSSLSLSHCIFDPTPLFDGTRVCVNNVPRTIGSTTSTAFCFPIGCFPKPSRMTRPTTWKTSVASRTETLLSWCNRDFQCHLPTKRCRYGGICKITGRPHQLLCRGTV